MTWQKPLIIIFLFDFFALLQKSFFVHFSLFGAVPNFVFIFFFLLVFFAKPHEKYQTVFLAIIAGFFLDIFSYSYIGPSIVLLIIIGFSIKLAQALLKGRDGAYPFAYFLPLFFIFFEIYSLAIGAYFHFLNFNIFSVIYNLIFASAFFYIYRWINGKKV